MSDQGNQSNRPDQSKDAAQPPKGAPVPAVTQNPAAQPPEAASGPRAVAPTGQNPPTHPPGSAPADRPAQPGQTTTDPSETGGSTTIAPAPAVLADQTIPAPGAGSGPLPAPAHEVHPQAGSEANVETRPAVTLAPAGGPPAPPPGGSGAAAASATAPGSGTPLSAVAAAATGGSTSVAAGDAAAAERAQPTAAAEAAADTQVPADVGARAAALIRDQAEVLVMRIMFDTQELVRVGAHGVDPVTARAILDTYAAALEHGDARTFAYTYSRAARPMVPQINDQVLPFRLGLQIAATIEGILRDTFQQGFAGDPALQGASTQLLAQLSAPAQQALLIEPREIIQWQAPRI
jgi:hypothetical protein